jgi:mannose-6-phosphate isomerase-like protein (cupin superfamily)
MLDSEKNTTYQLHDGERLTLRGRTPELLEVEAEWGPSATKPLPHRHPGQDERFVVHEGELTVDLDGTRRVLHAGDELEVPRGRAHRMWNSGAGPCRATWQVRPALRTEEFWEAVHIARQTKPTDAHGMLTPVAAAPILRTFRDEFRLAWPEPVQAPALLALSAIARLSRT